MPWERSLVKVFAIHKSIRIVQLHHREQLALKLNQPKFCFGTAITVQLRHCAGASEVLSNYSRVLKVRGRGYLQRRVTPFTRLTTSPRLVKRDHQRSPPAQSHTRGKENRGKQILLLYMQLRKLKVKTYLEEMEVERVLTCSIPALMMSERR